jgi:hypothetical protein
MNTSASFPLSAEEAIFARARQKIEESRCKFLQDFDFCAFVRRNQGCRI